MFESRLESVEVISTVLEPPEAVLCVPWMFPLIMVRDCLQRPSILRIVPRDNANKMRVRPHDYPCVSCWDAPPPVVSNYAGYIVDPMIEIEA